jgi:DNA polymerase alpha/epsilon subunit B
VLTPTLSLLYSQSSFHSHPFYHSNHSYHSRFVTGKPLSVVIASGPFTTSENLDYAPFEDLLAEIVMMKPDVVILTGPFVDITQPILQSGEVEVFSEEEGLHQASYEMVFIEKINRDGLGKLYNTDDRLATHIVLVPSLLDAHHEFVFPQPPFGDRDRVTTSSYKEDFGILNLPNSVGANKRVHCMPNPCMFRYYASLTC